MCDHSVLKTLINMRIASICFMHPVKPQHNGDSVQPPYPNFYIYKSGVVGASDDMVSLIAFS